MFKHYFEQIEGIGIYPVFSLLVFFLFFAGLLWWAWKTSQDFINHMRNLPLDPAEDDEQQAEGRARSTR